MFRQAIIFDCPCPHPHPPRILALALPLLLQYSIGHLSHMIDTAFVGHLDDPVMLSAMVLGGSFSMAAG